MMQDSSAGALSTSDNSAPQSVPTETPEGQPQQPSQKFKIKIDGTEEEVDIETVKRDYQKFRAADKRFQEAAQMRKQYEPLAKAIQDGNLDEVTKLIGDNEKTRLWAEKYLMNWLEYQQLPEPEKRARAAEERAKKTEEELSGLKKKTETEQMDSLRAEATKEIDTEISEVIAEFGKKPTPLLIKRIAEEMLASLTIEGRPRLPAKAAKDVAIKGLLADVKEYLPLMTEAELMERLTPKQIAHIRNSAVEEVMSQAPKKARQAPETEVTRSKNPKRMSTDEMFKQLERRFGS